MPDDHKTVIGPASGVQLSVLAMVIVGVAGGAMWVGRSAAEFETLKSVVYEIRQDVKVLGDQVRKLPQIQRSEPKQ